MKIINFYDSLNIPTVTHACIRTKVLHEQSAVHICRQSRILLKKHRELLGKICIEGTIALYSVQRNKIYYITFL